MIVSEVCEEIFIASKESTAKNCGNGDYVSHKDSRKRLWQARLPLAMCGALALVMQLFPRGTTVGKFDPSVRSRARAGVCVFE